MQNWRARDFNLYDDFRPIWEDLDINQRKRERQELIMQLNQIKIQLLVIIKLSKKNG